MRALTLWRPWTWAVCHAGKRIENRPWRPWLSVMGQEIALHAGKTYDRAGRAIIKAVAETRSDVRWHAVEYREECLETLRAIQSVEVAVGGAFQRKSEIGRYAVCCGNPPYAAALEFVQHAMRFAPLVVMLLRLNWLASAKRAEWMRGHTPSVFVLPDRPSFVGTGGDATDYAWLVWGLHNPPVVAILGSTSAGEREGHALRVRGQRDLFAAP